MDVLEPSQSRLLVRAQKALGIPVPTPLRRSAGAWQEDELKGRKLIWLGQPKAELATSLAAALASMHVSVFAQQDQDQGLPAVLLHAQEFADPMELAAELRVDALLFDATGIETIEDLHRLHGNLSPLMDRLAKNGRVLLFYRAPEKPGQSALAACIKPALQGFIRSLSKELGRFGSTVNLLLVESGAEAYIEPCLRFFLSPRAAFISAQTLTLAAPNPAYCPEPSYHQPLAGKLALVTGAAQGIGEGIAEQLAQEGAHVIGVDRPGTEQLKRVMARIGGDALFFDVSAEDTPAKLSARLQQEFAGLDILVHNAGITRDKTFKRMSQLQWQSVIDINLAAVIRINAQLLADQTLSSGGRILCLSSISGLAGNAGQTNYALSKGGLVGYVEKLAEQLADQGICVNAVAPGFIETKMTAAIPFMVRQVGRRFNALQQGGYPKDIAELAAFFSSPGAAAISGQVVRVCGHNLLGQ